MEEKTFFNSCLVFNSIPPSAEGFDPIIYWNYSNDNEDKNYRLNQVGLIITFIRFALKFNQNEPCEYIFTSRHETAMLQLHGNIWFSITVNSNSSRHKFILVSILKYFKSMFSTFWVDVSSLPESPESEQIILKYVPEAFQTLINSINWSRLEFTFLFNSYTTRFFSTGMDELAKICNTIISEHSNLIDNIAILSGKRCVCHSTFDPHTTRSIAFGLKKSFKKLFLHRPCVTRKYTWLIGPYINDVNLLSIYQPTINYDHKTHYLAALKLNHYRIVISQPFDLAVEENLFDQLIDIIQPIQQFLNSHKLSVQALIPPVPFNIILDNPAEQHMKMFSKDLVNTSWTTIDENVTLSHTILCSYSNLLKIAFPGPLGFSVMGKIDNGKELIVQCLTNETKVSNIIKFCEHIKTTEGPPPENSSSCNII